MDRFIVAGIEAVAKFGVDNVSVQFVSELAKGSRPTFYSYFGDINGLLAEIWVAGSQVWLEQVANPTVGHSAWTDTDKRLHCAMSEVMAVAHRIPEVNEVVQLTMHAWWAKYAKSTELEKLKVYWLVAERLGVSITEPVDPNVHQAEFIEKALLALTPEIATKQPLPLKLPKLSDPEFENESLDVKLLQSSIYIIANSGVRAASMARIARRTQVSTGSVYPRFSSTEEIVEASFELAISQIVRQNFAIVGNLSFSSEDFGSIVMAGLEDSRKTWRNFRIEIHLGARSRPSLSKRMQRNLRETNAIVAGGLKPISSPELANGPVPYLMHSVGIGFAILQNAGLPVAKLDHRVITVGLTRLLNA
jgi:AcrR family transcriptional regulator